MFGAFGYELDLNRLTEDEFAMVQEQIRFVKEHRKLLQYGKFYRLRSPFEKNQAAWMVVSEDKSKAILAVYTMRATVNIIPGLLKLAGLDSDKKYAAGDKVFPGDVLMEAGIPLRKDCIPGYNMGNDGNSAILVLKETK
jgi:alpha-galactosidase